MQPSNFDYGYAIFGILMSIVMMFSPRTLMRGAKYDEEGLKTESLVKKMGIALLVASIAFGIYIFMR